MKTPLRAAGFVSFVLVGWLAVASDPSAAAPPSADRFGVAAADLQKPQPEAEWRPAAAPLASRWVKDVRPEQVHPEYPRPQMTRSDWLNLNGLWELQFADGQTNPPVGETLPERILVPFPVESSLSGVRKRVERVWYRREFRVPSAWSGRHVLLHFGAVDWQADVFINGQAVGTHRGGYDPFSFDITDYLGGDGPQELIVGVFDPTDDGSQPRGKQVKEPERIWYTPATGIWQTVWLEPVSPARIERLVITPDLDAGCARLLVEGHNTGPVNTVEVEVFDEGQSVVRAFGGVGADIILEIPAAKLKPWTPDAPHLYDVEVQLQQGEIVVDRVESYFAMRTTSVEQDEQGRARLMLNGEPLFQMGVLDQGYWPAGIYTAPTDEALRYDIEAARRLGFNMIRKHVKVEPARWYFWCDTLGMLVWQDMPNGNNASADSRDQFATELRRVIQSRAGHPSIIGWVVFNEGWGQHDTARYVDLVRQIDPTRPIDAASGWNDRGVGDVVDLHAYPGPPRPEAEPDRAAMVGEFGGLSLPVPDHTWSKHAWGYRSTADSAQLTVRYEALVHEAWALARNQALSAAVYTQLTDVETECNGLLTYDRAITKVDVTRVAAANRGLMPRMTPIVPTARTERIAWRYTLDQPPAEWIQPDFDAAGWRQGPGGFGTRVTPAAVVGTVWNSGDIWLRREFELTERDVNKLWLLVHHDEDVEVYINGVLALAAGGYTVDYRQMPIRPAARETLRVGKNTMAVHCRNREGGQFIDAGLVEVELRPVH